jgi:hypothetical protein
MRKKFSWAIFVSCALQLASAEVQPVAGILAANRIRSDIVVLSPQWSAQIPPTGRVNAPEFFSILYPGQPMAFGLIAEGPDRGQIFASVSVNVRFGTGPGSTREFHQLKPTAVRSLKAEGADVALMALQAAGISGTERAKVEAATSLVTLAVFAPDWIVPSDGRATEVEISVEVSGGTLPATIAPIHLKIRTTADWLKEPLQNAEEVGRQMNRYHSAVAPGQLLSWFQALAATPRFSAPPVHGYFAFAFKSDAAVRAAAEAYPLLEARAQPPLLLALRLGGQDVGQLFPKASPTTTAALATVEPFEDPPTLAPFREPVEPTAVKRLGQRMDLCWAAWMATGDKGYLRCLVDLLAGAADYPAFKSWQESRGGAKGLNARVATGLEYQIAGWSIGSFQRTDPLVMDWLLYWESDPTVPAAVRREIATLATNPAFRRK